MAKRCLIVTYYFPPTGGGGVQRNVKLIKYLSREDWKFTVITCVNAPSNIAKDESLLTEVPEDVEIINVPNPAISGKKSLLGKVSTLIKSTFLIRWVTSFIYIPDRFKSWTKPVGDRVEQLVAKNKFDIVFISSPPYSLVQLAAELTQKLPIPVVLDMRDPWTTHPLKIHPSPWHFSKDRKMEMQAIRQIKHGVSVTQSLLSLYEQTVEGFKTENWRYIPNGFDEEDFKNLRPQELDKSKFHIGYSGTFYSHLTPPDLLFKAIAELDPALKSKVCFHHIGTSMIPLKKIAARFGLAGNIKEWGYKEHKESLNILAGMDILCFILDSSNKYSVNTIGGKVYEYLRLGKPILA